MTDNMEGLIPRKVETKQASPLSCIVFTIDEMEANFKSSMDSFNDYIAESIALEKDGKSNFAQDINRFLLANLESVFDYFVHCLIKLAFQNIFLQTWPLNPRYEKFSIPMNVLNELLADNSNPEPLIRYVNERTSADTYLNYEKFKDIVACVSQNFLEQVVTDLYPSKHAGLKAFMDDIYNKRNLVAHQDGRINLTGKKVEFTIDELIHYRDQISKLVDKMIEKVRDISSSC